MIIQCLNHVYIQFDNKFPENNTINLLINIHEMII